MGVIANRTVIHLQDRDLDSTVSCPCPVRDDYLRWRKFVAICRSLHRDGLDYIVTVEPHNKRILIGAAGRVRPRKPARPAYSIPDPPDEAQARKALELARMALGNWKRNLRKKWGWWRGDGGQPAYDAGQRERRRSFGRWLASRLARRPRGFRDTGGFVPNATDYASGDKTFGRKLPRLSKLPKSDRESAGWVRVVARREFGIYTWGWKPKAADADAPAVLGLEGTPNLGCPAWVAEFLGRRRAQPVWDPVWDHELARIEVEYWAEILRLLEVGNGNQGQA